MHSSTPAWLSTKPALHPHYHCFRQKRLTSIVLFCNRSVGGQPIVFDRVKGPYCWDVDGNKYVDYIGSWGPAIVGAANDVVNEALKAQIEKGTSFGAPSALEVGPWDMQPYPCSLLGVVICICLIMPVYHLVQSMSSIACHLCNIVHCSRGELVVNRRGCCHSSATSLLTPEG